MTSHPWENGGCNFDVICRSVYGIFQMHKTFNKNEKTAFRVPFYQNFRSNFTAIIFTLIILSNGICQWRAGHDPSLGRKHSVLGRQNLHYSSILVLFGSQNWVVFWFVGGLQIHTNGWEPLELSIKVCYNLYLCDRADKKRIQSCWFNCTVQNNDCQCIGVKRLVKLASVREY